ncbi:hypothetical protein [Nocardioides ganghwensis]|uniref:Uncharacterized protein n=1 Tax=Nocardioides ganghwensis TaxID=252230 RepID=A0A4Q2S846_9ACTN|nr:hypothetical protein [Nocardioides ganghwensis]MBD3947563.1 hypothetical protein [Nocardioides ganghwensis]RYB99418.1 hypothetical protein EUA07_16460 [Nocardioides ganghwensis]
MAMQPSLEPDDARRRLREAAVHHGLRIFDAVPAQNAAASVWWPEPLDPEGFVGTAAELGMRILHIEEPHSEMIEDWGLAMFALDGVLHWYECGRSAGDPEDDDDVTVEIEEEDELPTPAGDATGRTKREVMAMVKAIVDDPEYDPYHLDVEAVLDRHAGSLTPDERANVDMEARIRFSPVFDALRRRARPIAESLVSQHAPDPFLSYDMKVVDWVRERAPELEPRMASYVAPWIDEKLDKDRQRAYRRAEDAARDVLASLDPETRDRFGFASRNAIRDGMVAEAVDELSETLEHFDRLRDHVLYKMRGLEEELYGLSREKRYATVAQALAQRLPSKAAVARELGITPNTLNRLLTSYPQDVDIDESDHLRRLLEANQ